MFQCIRFLNIFFILRVSISFLGVTSALDLTCFSTYPRIDITGNDDHFIGGYKGIADKDVEISFGRTVDTGQGDGLPPGRTRRYSRYTRYFMPISGGGGGRIGAFYCEAETKRITTITMAKNSKNMSFQKSLVWIPDILAAPSIGMMLGRSNVDRLILMVMFQYRPQSGSKTVLLNSGVIANIRVLVNK